MKNIFIVLICINTISACKSKKETIKPVVKDITKCVYASGVVKSKNQYEVYSTVSGIVTKEWVQEGDSIGIGDPLYSLNSKVADLQKENLQLLANNASKEQNKSKLNEALLQLELARNKMLLDSSIYFRQKSLYAQQVGSKLDLEKAELSYTNAKTAYYSASVRYEDLKKQIELNDKQQKNLLAIGNNTVDDYVIRSQVRGKVYKMNKKTGELASPQIALALIGSSNEFIIEMQVDERDIIKIQKGLKAIISLESYPGKTFNAYITSVNPIMDSRSKTFLIEAAFESQPDVLYPLLTLEASIIIEEKKNVLLIPVNYLLNDSTVILENKKEHPVKTGLKDNTMVEVVSGLTINDVLVKPKP